MYLYTLHKQKCVPIYITQTKNKGAVSDHDLNEICCCFSSCTFLMPPQYRNCQYVGSESLFQHIWWQSHGLCSWLSRVGCKCTTSHLLSELGMRFHEVLDRCITCLSFSHLGICVINPQRACAARVTVLGLSFCLSVCLSVRTRYSGSTRD